MTPRSANDMEAKTMLAVCWMVGVAISVIRTSKFVQKEIAIIRENIKP